MPAFLFLASCGETTTSTTTQTTNVTATGVEQKTTIANTSSTGTNTTTSTTTLTDSASTTHKDVVMADTLKLGLEAPTLGSGDHVMQIFADFQCPACQSAEKSINPVLESFADAGKLKIEYRQYPLTQIHKNAQGDALAAMCAMDQNKYYEYKKELYDYEVSKGGATVGSSDHIALAEKLGLDKNAFQSCISSEKYKDYIAKSIALGDKLGVQGTPTYILDGKQLSMAGFTSVDQFKSFMEAFLAKSATTTSSTTTTTTTTTTSGATK